MSCVAEYLFVGSEVVLLASLRSVSGVCVKYVRGDVLENKNWLLKGLASLARSNPQNEVPKAAFFARQ